MSKQMRNDIYQAAIEKRNELVFRLAKAGDIKFILEFVESPYFLNIKTWSGMKLIIESVWKNKRTSVRACHGSSKTFCAAVIAVTFFNMYADRDCVVVTTAPTGRQVEKLLWKEINNIYATRKLMKSGRELIGECLNVSVKDPEHKASYMFGFSTDNQTSSEGYHSANILWIVDEAKDSPIWLYDSIEGSLTGKNCHVLEISTTDGADQQCNFRRHHSQRDQWKCIAFSAFDSPFVDSGKYSEFGNCKNRELFQHGKPAIGSEWNKNEFPEIAIADEGWIDDKKNTWFVRDKYLWDTKVCGEFSELSESNLIPLAWVESAIDAEVGEEDVPVYGLDVARYGVDSDVLTKKKGQAVKWQETWGKADTMTTVGKVINFIDDPGAMSVDVIGVGAGVHDRLAELVEKDDCRKISVVIGVDSAQKSETEIDNRTFYNYRAELFWKLRSLFEDQYKTGNSISIPNIPELIEELTAIRYSYHSSGKILIEPTEKIKERIGRSPDRACSLAYSCVVVPVDSHGRDDLESFVNGL